MESYLQKLWKKSYEEIQIRIKILVKRTLKRMTSLEGTQRR